MGLWPRAVYDQPVYAFVVWVVSAPVYMLVFILNISVSTYTRYMHEYIEYIYNELKYGFRMTKRLGEYIYAISCTYDRPLVCQYISFSFAASRLIVYACVLEHTYTGRGKPRTRLLRQPPLCIFIFFKYELVLWNDWSTSVVCRYFWRVSISHYIHISWNNCFSS